MISYISDSPPVASFFKHSYYSWAGCGQKCQLSSPYESLWTVSRCGLSWCVCVCVMCLQWVCVPKYLFCLCLVNHCLYKIGAASLTFSTAPSCCSDRKWHIHICNVHYASCWVTMLPLMSQLLTLMKNCPRKAVSRGSNLSNELYASVSSIYLFFYLSVCLSW